MPLPHRVSGINRKDALALARQLGCRVSSVRRSGEIRVTHLATGRFITLNGRRKDASRKLSGLLNRLLHQAQPATPGSVCSSQSSASGHV